MTGTKPATGIVVETSEFRWPFAIIFIICYFAFQALLVTCVSNGAGLDDAEQLANIGYLDWGYGGSQPPLYTWITNFAASIFGTSMLTLQLVKFGLLASLFISVYGGMRLLGFSRLVASASSLGMFLIPQISWESQRALTHSVAGTAGCGWAFCAFAWHMRKRSVVSAAVLGVAMAAALLGKFNASFFLIMLIITGLSVADFRKVLLSAYSFVTAAAFAIAMAPTGLWMWAHKSSVLARSAKFQMGVSENVLLDRLHGLTNLIEASFMFSALALGVAGLIALIYYKKRQTLAEPYSAGELFMRRLLIVGLLIVLIGVLVTGANDVKDRWLQPVLFLLPAMLACRFFRFRANSRALIDFSVVSACVALLVSPVLAYYLTYGSKVPPYGQLDYQHLYQEVKSRGEFHTALTDNAQIPGNFRLFDPTLQVVHPETPDAAKRISKPTLVMWFGDATPNVAISNLMSAAGITPPATGIQTTTIAYKTKPDRAFTVSYFLVP